MLTPADIDNKQFGTTRLKEGYDQDEVDNFLDLVKADYEFLQQSVARLDEENRALRRKVSYHEAATGSEAATTVLPKVEPTEPSEIIKKMLSAAETAAREHEAEAKARADEIVREAGAQGARAVEEAQAAAERIKSEGLAEKYRRVEELEAKIRNHETVVSELRNSGDQIRRAVQAALSSYDKELNL